MASTVTGIVHKMRPVIWGDPTLEVLGLTNASMTVHQVMLDHPGYSIEEIAAHCALMPTQVHDHLDELSRLTLVRASAEHSGRLHAVSPGIGLADLLAGQEAELAARQAQLVASRAAVTRMVAERADQHANQGERLHGMDAIHDRLELMGRAATTEVLSSQPGIQRPEDLAASRPSDTVALGRGITMRTLYQDATRNQPHITSYAHWLLSQGSEVRTAPTIPQRMVVVDRTQALVPIDPTDTRQGALHVTEPGILAALLDFFEQAWNTAVPLGATRPDDPRTGITPTEREILRLLSSGLTDDTVGQRLGISSRTVGRHMSSIMERLGAGSRFEAGIKAAHKGWL